MKRFLIAAAIIAPLFNPVSAIAQQTEVDQGFMQWKRQARIDWNEKALRLAVASPEPEPVDTGEATATVPVPLGEIPRIIYSIFGSYGAKAVDVASCESGLDPWNVNPSSQASGLFQLMPFHWWGSFDPFDPVANTRYAYQLSNGGTDWSAWSRKCA
jgi:hypothetical protein